MIKRIKKTKKKRPKRRDEKNLYYIIERDLDREVLFPGNSGWEPQAFTKRDKNYKIDYIVNYEDEILGIDLKYDFPIPKHFKQVNEKYKDSLNAVYLAYPADRVGEALDIINQKEEYQDFGLISVALFRSNCIRAATVIDNPPDNYLISGGEYSYDFFNNSFREELKNSGLEGFNKRKIELVKEVLDGDHKYFKLSSTQLKTLYYLIKSSDLYSPLKYFRLDGPHGFGRFIEHKWNLSNLLETSLIYEISYGTSLNTVTPSAFSMYFRRKIVNKVKNEDKKEIESALLQIKKKKKEDIEKNRNTYLTEV